MAFKGRLALKLFWLRNSWKFFLPPTEPPLFAALDAVSTILNPFVKRMMWRNPTPAGRGHGKPHMAPNADAQAHLHFFSPARRSVIPISV
jgi:hypothetical protein